MGTYYAKLTGDYSGFCELANVSNPGVIKEIHQQYIKAGSKLIRTNTFSANSFTLKISKDKLEEIITSGVKIAKEACEDQHVYILADVGPIPELDEYKQEINQKQIIEEYKFIVDTFLKLGLDIFVFETFSSLDYLNEITKYIKTKNKNSFIIAQFVVMADGYTRKGVSANKIVEGIKNIESIDIMGFNCGTGPTHLLNNISKVDFMNNGFSALPNSGFPEVVNERTIYSQNEDYFAEVMIRLILKGAKIIGGCCGTTPVHIQKIKDNMNKEKVTKNTQNEAIEKAQAQASAPENRAFTIEIKESKNIFKEKLKNNQFVFAVELDPPFNSDASKLISGAKTLKNNGVDVITIADSPLGRARVNSIMTAAKIKREVGIDVVPHICCRDRNIIGLKSDILAAHMEGIRNILLVTGDPIPSAEKNEIKSVFNMNSITLINKNLNNGIDNIICIRIIDIIEKIKNGELSGLTRKEAKILWVISGKKKELFDNSIWSI